MEATAHQQSNDSIHGIRPLRVYFTFMPILPRAEGKNVMHSDDPQVAGWVPRDRPDRRDAGQVESLDANAALRLGRKSSDHIEDRVASLSEIGAKPT